MNIQIFGHGKCKDTKKAERFFKERRIPFQMIDITVKPMSKGEFQSVKGCIGLEALISESSKDYKDLNMDKIRTPEVREDILFKHQKLMKTPIVRNGRVATAGYAQEQWESWIKDDK